MANPFDRGRPRRIYPDTDDIANIPDLSGEYRIYTATGVSKYVGETSNLRRRISQHVADGMIRAGQYVDYLVADGRSSSATRRVHESDSIEKKRPTTNQRRGGGGRRAR
jgi:GIY-YIG catalytic domain-containing protein